MTTKVDLKEKDGCVYVLFVIFNIISLMWILAGGLSIKKSIKRFSTIRSASQIELQDFEIIDHETSSGGGKSGTYVVYQLNGYIRSNQEKIKVNFTGYKVDYYFVKKILSEKQAKVWYLSNKTNRFARLQLIYPTKEDLIDHCWQSLILFFFIPLSMLIRLIVLYKLGRFELPKTQ